jgi:arsenical pump membrane protein
VPAAVVDLVAVAALVVLLAVAFTHPRGRVEAAVAVGAAAVVLAVGAVDPHGATAQVDRLLPVVGFLAAILVVSEMCAAEGLFVAVGGEVARFARHRPQRMLALTFVAAALVTAVLSLDATVVLLTPVVAAAAAGSGIRSRPMVLACVRLANSASLLLPVSNLTNLLALPDTHLTFLGFGARMAPAWAAVLAVEYVGHRLFFRRDLGVPPRPGGEPYDGPLPVVPLVVVALMLVGFAVGSPAGIAPAWVAALAAVVLAGYSLHRGRVRPATVVRAAHLPFAVFVLGLGVVVAGLSDSFLGAAVSALLPAAGSLPALLGIALTATLLANLVNNLPATLLVVPLVAPLGTTAVLAALMGLNVGSGLTYPGSLANLLWRRTLTRRGHPPRARDFHALSAVVTLPAVVVGVVAVWAWSGVLDR